LLTRVRIHEDHQIISEPGESHCRPPLVPGHCFRPFQHLVHLIEVQITEQEPQIQRAFADLFRAVCEPSGNPFGIVR
jgi:hypothetical protein